MPIQTPWGPLLETTASISAAALFGSFELSILAKFALAAYHLGPHETQGSGINAQSTASELAFAELSANVEWLEYTDLAPPHISGGLASVLPAFAPGDAPFGTRGLLNGVYVHENAAVLVGRTTDALFISFRGTNDIVPGEGGLEAFLNSGTPDVNDWDDKGSHYELFQDLLAAIDSYVENPTMASHMSTLLDTASELPWRSILWRPTRVTCMRP